MTFLSQGILATDNMRLIDKHIAEHPGQTGTYILEKGEEALLARAWLTDHAEQTIEVQYFIWSTDNIGILASEALLRAANRGVKVRVIVDDLLIDAPDNSLLALASHPNIDIKTYNPKHSVGVSFFERILHLFTDFRSFNQRMHDKVFVVDGKVAITGGRNMADEYFDYNHEYNFRDRDVLLIGGAATDIKQSFERFWASDLSSKIQDRFSDEKLFKLAPKLQQQQIDAIYKDLHSYAQSENNFETEVRQAIAELPKKFAKLAESLIWTQVDFISDIPGKNSAKNSLSGGGQSTTALKQLVEKAQQKVLIQSPYLVFSNQAIQLFSETINRGVEVTINTNSMAATDNNAAFSGYRNQRQQLLDMGINIHEYKPDPKIHKVLLERHKKLEKTSPIFAIHAKTMVVDSTITYIGTFNFDPRSQNLNTEVGAIINNAQLAKNVEKMILRDSHPDNSWSASSNPDQHAPLSKRIKIQLLQWLPLKPLL